MLELIYYGNPILRKKGEKITQFDEELAQFARAMVERVQVDDNSIGLAAQQVGRAMQLCVADLSIYFKNGKYKPADVYKATLDGKSDIPPEILFPLVLVNPVVRVCPNSSLSTIEESCMSFPGSIYGSVERPDVIEVDYQDLQGNSHHLVAGGFLSRVIQHEVDHLNGVLFIDRMEPRTVHLMAAKLKKLKRQTRNELKEQGGRK